MTQNVLSYVALQHVTGHFSFR